ncbi:TA system VapC family ribonuclease toxin [Ideonella sp.]|jgi:toxin-antitoxin system PIN domain toxin|uniref:TA system VapC family ribonuclease toxin n=1 Tax=Ideonella sp. TaxID=1929293 RepID=UPI0037BECD62
MTPDVNVLLAASRSDHPHHTAALAWLNTALIAASQGTRFSLQPMVVASFIRLATNSRLFPNPTPPEHAVQFVEALLQSPGVSLANLGPEWPTLGALCSTQKLSANAVPDAWLAAAVLHQGEHLVSFDGDFKQLLPKSQFTRLRP